MDPTGFAEAQRRLAERRRAREAELARSEAAARARTSLDRLSSPISRLLGLDVDGRGARPAFRVGQVDAELLDEELVELLRGRVGEALRYFGGGGGGQHLKDDWAAEIQLALRAALFKLTVWDHDATYGAALQNLRYTDARHEGLVLVPPSRWQKGIYGLVTVAGRYAWTKWEAWLLDREDGYGDSSTRIRQLSGITSAISTAHAAAAFASFLVFLLHGRYRTLLDRVLRMRLAPPTSQVSREVSLEYLNRQLVWHAFTEFLLFVLPLVGINRWRRWLSRAWRRTKDLARSGGGGGEGGSEGAGELSFLPERTCAICYQDQTAGAMSETEVLAASGGGGVVGSAQTDITNPYETVPCGCVYCWVCLVGRLEREEGEGWTCLRCGALVKECKPWSGDVLEKPETAIPGSAKAGTSPTSSSSQGGAGGRGGAKTVAFSDEVRVKWAAGFPVEEAEEEAEFVSAAGTSDEEAYEEARE